MRRIYVCLLIALCSSAAAFGQQASLATSSTEEVQESSLNTPEGRVLSAAGHLAGGGIVYGGGVIGFGSRYSKGRNFGRTKRGTGIAALDVEPIDVTPTEDPQTFSPVLFKPNQAQLSVGDANGTAAMLNLRGQSTCCGPNVGFADAKVYQNGSFVFTGNLGIGVSPMEGKGYRTSWHTYKGAFRSGYADSE